MSEMEMVSKAHHEAVVRGLSATIEAQRERLEEANEARRNAWRDGYLEGKKWAERPQTQEPPQDPRYPAVRAW